jgi:hypothetical protein
LKNLLLIILLNVVSPSFTQVQTIDRSDTTIHLVHDFFYGHWRMYPMTSAMYVPPCEYRIVPPDTSKVDFIESYVPYNREEFQLVEQHDKYGIVNKGDTVIIPLLYDSLIRITSSHPKIFIAELDDTFGLLNSKNEVVIPFEYEAISLMTNGHYNGFMYSSLRVEKNGKYGLMWVDGTVALSCQYDFIETRCNQVDCPKQGIQYYVEIDGKRGYINEDESVAIDIEYEALNADGFSGLIKANNDGKVGLMDTLKNFILPQNYEGLYKEYMTRFPNLTSFKKDGKWGLMYGDYSDMTVVLENRFDSVMTKYDFRDHFIIINDGNWGLADTNGKVVIEPQFEELRAMEDGTYAYKKNGRWGFMSNKGLIHCSPRYDEIYENEKNWCLVQKGEGYGFCKTSGRQIAAPIYGLPYWDDYVYWGDLLSRGRIAMSIRDENDECKLGVIDSTGKVLLPFEYDCYDEIVYNFGRVLIARKNGKEVLLSGDGKEIYVGDFDRIEERRHGHEYFFPIKGEKVGLVSFDGTLLSKPKYDKIDFLWVRQHEWNVGPESKLFFLIEQNSKVGVIDSVGKVVLQPIHEELNLKDDFLIEVVSDDQVRLYNLNTNVYEPFSTDRNYQFIGQVGVFRGSGGKSLFIDSLGNRIDEALYDEIWLVWPDKKYFKVEMAGRYGICDSAGTLLFEPKFSKIKFWDGEFGAGKLGNSYCFFDRRGDTIVNYRYRKVKGVYENFVCVKIDSWFGVVTKTGETVIEPTLQEKLNFEPLKEFGLTIFKEAYKSGVINAEMKAILPPKFNSIELIKVHERSYVIALIGKTVELYDYKGSLISKILFSKWEQNESGELFLFDDFSWYKLMAGGDLEKTER